MTDKQLRIQYYDTPFGKLDLGSFQDKLCLCNWAGKKNKAAVARRLQRYLPIEATVVESSSIIEQAKLQLQAYFEGKSHDFTVPLVLAGTPFQQQVWQQLRTIAYGHTISYADLAKQIHQPRAVRAVANANAANALSIIIPCHRIIGSNGQLTGYAGGLITKQQLIALEQTA